MLLLLLALGTGVAELARAGNTAEAIAAAPPVMARVQAKRVVATVVEGPQRGRKITLRRGDVVELKKSDGEILLVVDAKGNQVRVKRQHVKLP